jgi:HPt (histidine-containing phosphotransfer) domain-containing protein
MPLTDLTFLREFCRNDRQKVAQYVKIFLESVPEIMNELDQQLNEKNPDALRKTVHSIKPQVTFLGIESLKEQVDEIEISMDATTSASKLTSMIGQLKLGLEQAADELVETLVSLS